MTEETKQIELKCFYCQKTHTTDLHKGFQSVKAKCPNCGHVGGCYETKYREV